MPRWDPDDDTEMCDHCREALLTIDPHAPWRRGLTLDERYHLCDRCALRLVRQRREGR